MFNTGATLTVRGAESLEVICGNCWRDLAPRILYAFDLQRQALLLVAGNKAGDKKWYGRMMKKAEAIFEAHLEQLKEEEDEKRQNEKAKRKTRS